MAINVTLGEVKTQTEKSFPKLMKSKETGIVVFFEREATGQVLIGNIYHNSGDIQGSWDMSNFTDYNEPITIQNA